MKLLNTHLLNTPARKRFFVGVGFVGIGILLSASLFATAPSPVAQQPAEKVWPVSTKSILPQALSPTFTGYGKVEAAHVAQIRTDLVAKIQTVFVSEGQWVTKGDKLVDLDSRQIKLSLATADATVAQESARLRSIETEGSQLSDTTEHFESSYEISQNKLKRHQDLLEKRLIANSLFDEAQQQANRATIDYREHKRQLTDLPNRMAAQQAVVSKAIALRDQAQLNLDNTQILAPFSGPVLSVSAAPGDYSSLGSLLAIIADAESLEVRLQIPDIHREQFEITDQVNAMTKSGIQLRLNRYSGNVKIGQSGLDAFFRSANVQDSKTLQIGRLMEIKVSLPVAENLVALPVQSLYQNNRVYQVVDGRLQSITVDRIGEQESLSGEYQVLVRSSEFVAGQNILTTQLPRAISGLLVSVQGSVQGPAQGSTYKSAQGAAQ